MSVTTEYIHSLISQGEGLEVEFKESYDSLSRSVFDSICAFMNRNGGHILLGVDNAGTIKGLSEATVQHQLDVLARDMNNPQVISPGFFLSTELVTIQNKKIIYIYVPESSQVHTYKGVIFDRNEDGDFRLVNQQLIANFFKQLGWVEELGSGVRKMFKYCPLYINNSLPLIQEGDLFKITIRYEDIERMELDTEIGHDLGHDLQVNNVYVQVLKYLYKNPFSKKELAEKLGQLNVSGHLSRTIKRLFEDELIEYLITDNLNHPSQKFKLTEKGIEYHKTIIEKQQ